MSTGTWHYEGHYILTDSEPQVVIAERVSEANRGLIASAPTQQAKIEALADALEALVRECGEPYKYDGDWTALLDGRAALKAAGRIP